LVYEPSWFKGLRLQVNYYETEQKNVLQQLSPQNIVNNELSLPGRVTRGPDTDPNDTLPGPITGIDATFVNFGRVLNRSLDYTVDYDLPWETLGRWRLGLSATSTLESLRELIPGQPAIEQEGDTFAPPKWVYNGSLFWNRGPWNASAFLWYLDGFASNNAGGYTAANSVVVRMLPVPSVTKVDVNGGYQFDLDRGGLLGGFASGLRVTAGVSNLLDKRPPFSNTQFGYNAGLHSQLVLGRTYEFAFELTF
jgi:hypothetical protein